MSAARESDTPAPDPSAPAPVDAPAPAPVDAPAASATTATTAITKRKHAKRNAETRLQVSGTGEACEELLYKCIDGEYHMLPAFASKVWEWFAETPANDPNVMAQNIGQKAAYILYSMNNKFKEDDAKAPEKRQARIKTPDLTEVAVVFGAGVLIRDPFAWSISAACVVTRLLASVHMLGLAQTTRPLPECMVAAHAYLVLGNPVWIAGLHAIGWFAVWEWSARRLLKQ